MKSFKKINISDRLKCSEMSLYVTLLKKNTKPTKLKKMPPPKSPPHQLPSTAVSNNFKIQKPGGKSPTNQSDERSNFSGPRSTLIGRRQ